MHPRRPTLEAFQLCDGKWLALAVHEDTDRARIEMLWADVPLPTSASEEPAHYASEGH